MQRPLGAVVSNNIAEYTGFLDCLKHAERIPSQRICFRVDSKLVAQQVTGKWRCKSSELWHSYEEALAWLRRLREQVGDQNLMVEHIYREFNADADGVCNEILDAEHLQIPNSMFALEAQWS